jgi:radical SAM superfamily enzyme YgiQ (UPF0313 family)
MQSSAPELIASLCPQDADIELYNEKEVSIPMNKHWDIVFFSYLHPYYEHTKVLSMIFRGNGMITVAGGRHASLFYEDCKKYFDTVVIGYPEINIPQLIKDYKKKKLREIYNYSFEHPDKIKSYRYDLIDFNTNKWRGPIIEASRGCNFGCNFCVVSNSEKLMFRPINNVIQDITNKMRWNNNLSGILRNSFGFCDNNLGSSPTYLKELCEALIPLKKTWGCSLTLNILENERLVKLMAKAGCRYIYTGVESLNPNSINSLNKKQNRLKKLKFIFKRAFLSGINVTYGIIIGCEGDTNEYLYNLPHYISDFGFLGITFLGIVCPYPGTPFYKKLVKENRILPGTISRDLDSSTICFQPLHLNPSELAEHYKNLCVSIPKLTNIFKYSLGKMWMSNCHGYKKAIFAITPEILSIKKALLNKERTFIAGKDKIETWDAEMMQKLGIFPQGIPHTK